MIQISKPIVPVMEWQRSYIEDQTRFEFVAAPVQSGKSFGTSLEFCLARLEPERGDLRAEVQGGGAAWRGRVTIAGHRWPDEHATGDYRRNLRRGRRLAVRCPRGGQRR